MGNGVGDSALENWKKVFPGSSGVGLLAAEAQRSEDFFKVSHANFVHARNGLGDGCDQWGLLNMGSEVHFCI